MTDVHARAEHALAGVAKTGGNVTSLKRLARWSGMTTILNEPVAPTGIDCMDFPCSLMAQISLVRADKNYNISAHVLPGLDSLPVSPNIAELSTQCGP